MTKYQKAPSQEHEQDKQNEGTELGDEATNPRAISRRDFASVPARFGLAALVTGTLGAAASALSRPAAANPRRFELDLPPTDVPVRHGLGIAIVGASSGMGAEMARQYADHGAYIVLAARRVDRLNEVAAEVFQRGGVAHVIPTDVRDEAQCAALIQGAVSWLDGHGKVIDLLVLTPARWQIAVFGPEISSAVFRNVVETNYFGPVNVLKYALPHLKENHSGLFYFNSLASSIPIPLTLAYTSVKHAWHAITQVIRFENPEITTTSSQFNSVDTEGLDKELTYFDDDKRYCPSFFRTYGGLQPQGIYPASLAVKKAIDAIESESEYAFLSLLSKAAWLVGFTQRELSWFLLFLEQVIGYQRLQEIEEEVTNSLGIRANLISYGRHLHSLRYRNDINEIETAAAMLASVDETVALYLIGLNDLLDPDVLVATREIVTAGVQAIADGSFKQLSLALSSGALDPPGIADDDDGLAPVGHCPPANLGVQ